MRFLHLSDLHLGKTVLEAPMIEDQRAALEAAVAAAVEHNAEAVVIAGDIYDRSVPPAEAVRLFDDFISELSVRGIAVLAFRGITIPPNVWSSAAGFLPDEGCILPVIMTGHCGGLI